MTDTKKNKHRADMELVESFAFTQSLDNWKSTGSLSTSGLHLYTGHVILIHVPKLVMPTTLDFLRITQLVNRSTIQTRERPTQTRVLV